MKNINLNLFNPLEPGIPEIARNMVDRFEIDGKQVLEIGIGWGGFTAYCLEKRAVVTGIEKSEQDLFTAKNDIRLKSANLIVADGTKLPFENSKFDFVFAWEVIEHVEVGSEVNFFSEAQRVLKSGGFFVISTPNSNFFSKLLDPAYLPLKHRHYSPNQFKAYAKQSSFKPIEILQLGTWPLGIWNVFVYISKWIFRKKKNILSQDFFIRILKKNIRKEGWVSLVGIFESQR